MPASTRDNVANRVKVTLNGDELREPLSLVIGNESVYEDYSVSQLGAFVAYRPVPLRMTFPLSKNSLLRDIGKSEERMLEDHQIVIRFYGATGKQPLSVTNLSNVRFTSVTQHYKYGSQAYEELIATVEVVEHDK